MKFPVLFGRMAYFFDKHIDEAAAGRIADLRSNLFDGLLSTDQHDLGLFQTGVSQIFNR